MIRILALRHRFLGNAIEKLSFVGRCAGSAACRSLANRFGLAAAEEFFPEGHGATPEPNPCRPFYLADGAIGHSQISASGPPLPLASVLPSGENASDSSRFCGPVKVCRSVPVCASQSLIDLSLHPLA